MERTRTLMNKLVYLVLSILEMSKIVMYQFRYDFVKPKYGYGQHYNLHKN